MSIHFCWTRSNLIRFGIVIVPWLICVCASHVVVARGSSKVDQVAEDVLKCFNWGDSEAGISRMNEQGLADYLIWQWFNAKRIGDICEDLESVPEVASLVAICEEHDIDLEPLLRSQYVLRDSKVSENIRDHHAQFRQASSRLMRMYSEEQLRVIAFNVAQVSQRLSHCPHKFEMGDLSQKKDQVVVQAFLVSAKLSEQRESRGNLPAPLHLRFERNGTDWLFAGIDEKLMLADQLKVAAATDLSKIYIPNEFREVNVFDGLVRWSLVRSQQSEHFIVFWGKGYGQMSPAEAGPDFRVDIDDLLAKAEMFFETNVKRLKFAERGNSKLDHHKMLLFVVHSQEWIASGAGVDDVVGALWISPSTCQPVGSTVAHEIGHCFQYQVFCDVRGQHGFRYGFGGGGGNGFWEQSAQWQAFQDYPEEVFLLHQLDQFFAHCHRHFHHELMRYESYFLPYYWQEKHGPGILGKLWREAKEPEDPLQAYMRITGISVEQLHDEIYDAAAKMITWDIEPLRKLRRQSTAAFRYEAQQQADGFIRVAYNRCPGTTGFNVIRLNAPEKATTVRLQFKGIAGHPAFNSGIEIQDANWRYGFVAQLADGKVIYGARHQGKESLIEFEVPTGCSGLWLVVTGAPTHYRPHPWDDDETNDEQWPYEFRLDGTTVVGVDSSTGR